MTQRPLAELKWSRLQRASFLGIVLGSITLCIIDLGLGLWLWSLVLLASYSVIVLCKISAALLGLSSRFTIHISRATYDALDDETLPVFTILLPLYHESEVVEKLVAHIGNLDYPKDKLDVKVLLEENDDETLQAISAFGLPAWCELIIVPDIGPKTKPRACNVGLQHARGSYCVIYDAEDQPEPDQLKKVICAYQQVPDNVVCLQAKLNFFNAQESLLSRCFALEYTTWFDLYLPGLHAIRAPIPLGGTSNHFKTAALKQLDGWDPYNVTEDCDLGIRIAEAGHATRIIDSVTWEEAPCRIPDWIGQRSRWIKGYFQTFWVHTRQPWQRIRKLGAWGFFQMLLSVGGQVACVICNPICWLVLLLWLYWQWPIIYVHAPYTLVLFAVSLALFQFNALFLGIHLIAALRRRNYALLPAVTLLPFYWILVSIGAWRGVLEFFWSPYKWVKTAHGKTHIYSSVTSVQLLEINEQAPQRTAYIKSVSQHGMLHKMCVSLAILGLLALIAVSSFFAPQFFGYSAQVEQARIPLRANFVEDEMDIDQRQASWLDYDAVAVTLDLERHPSVQTLRSRDLRLLFFIKVRDGEWLHHQLDHFDVENQRINVTVPLRQNWHSVINDFPWDHQLLSRVRSFGVKVFSQAGMVHNVSLQAAKPFNRPNATPHEAPLRIQELTSPDQAQRYEVIELRWQLNKTYSNPFDSDVVRCDVLFTHESGSSIRIPAFYTQDYHQFQGIDGEQLLPQGRPYWCARFSPTLAGRYTWQLTASDYRKQNTQSDSQALQVTTRHHRGFAQLGKNPRHFAFEDGSYFYPRSINIRSPRDEINHDYFSFDMPAKELGSYVLYTYINKMKSAGINVGRVWMSPWFGGLEWNADETGYHGLGVYNLQNAFRLDRIFEFAAQQDILIELALNHHGPFTTQYDSQWADNPYNKENGGPAASPRHVLPHPDSQAWFKKRLRYVAARYGAYPNLFSYVLWIEANVVDPRPPVLLAWHEIFGPYMKHVDGDRHLVSTEFNNNGYPDIWRLNDIDYTQVAAYNFGKGNVRELIEAAQILKPYAKPALVEEYMGLPAGGHEDVLAHEFHDGLWAGFMLPLAGSPMPWWWNFIFEKNLHQQYTVFNTFIADEVLADHEWSYFNERLGHSDDLRALGRLTTDRALFWIYKNTVSNIRFGGRYRQRRANAHQAYRQAVGTSFSPIDAMTGQQESGFMNAEGAQLIIPAGTLSTGHYQLEYWDTWQAKPASISKLQIKALPYTLSLPRLDKDIAIKLRRIEQ